MIKINNDNTIIQLVVQQIKKNNWVQTKDIRIFFYIGRKLDFEKMINSHSYDKAEYVRQDVLSAIFFLFLLLPLQTLYHRYLA